jgi:hypothetical protein
MIAADRDSLACDLAETYGIFDLQALPASTLAALAVGLRDDSRIKLKIAGEKVPRQDMMQAAMVDRLSLLLWAKTKDGQSGVNRPKSLVDILNGVNREQGNVRSFDTPEDFEAEWARRTGVNHG